MRMREVVDVLRGHTPAREFFIAGQERRKKAEHIGMATAGKCDPAKMLMISDADGDMKAAKATSTLFIPSTLPTKTGRGKRLYEEALDVYLRT